MTVPRIQAVLAHRFFWLVVLSYLPSSLCFGQVQLPEPPEVGMFSPGKISPKKPDEVSVDYDKFEDRTRVWIETAVPLTVPPGIASEGQSAFWAPKVIVSVYCHGHDERCAPDRVSLTFVVHTTEWWYNDAEIRFLFDGTRLPVELVSWDGNVVTGDLLTEFLSFGLPTDSFLKLANSKVVECKVGIAQFKFSDENLTAFRSISNHVSH